MVLLTAWGALARSSATRLQTISSLSSGRAYSSRPLCRGANGLINSNKTGSQWQWTCGDANRSASFTRHLSTLNGNGNDDDQKKSSDPNVDKETLLQLKKRRRELLRQKHAAQRAHQRNNNFPTSERIFTRQQIVNHPSYDLGYHSEEEPAVFDLLQKERRNKHGNSWEADSSKYVDSDSDEESAAAGRQQIKSSEVELSDSEKASSEPVYDTDGNLIDGARKEQVYSLPYAFQHKVSNVLSDDEFEGDALSDVSDMSDDSELDSNPEESDDGYDSEEMMRMYEESGPPPEDSDAEEIAGFEEELDESVLRMSPEAAQGLGLHTVVDELLGHEGPPKDKKAKLPKWRGADTYADYEELKISSAMLLVRNWKLKWSKDKSLSPERRSYHRNRAKAAVRFLKKRAQRRQEQYIKKNELKKQQEEEPKQLSSDLKKNEESDDELGLSQFTGSEAAAGLRFKYSELYDRVKTFHFLPEEVLDRVIDQLVEVMSPEQLKAAGHKLLDLDEEKEDVEWLDEKDSEWMTDEEDHDVSKTLREFRRENMIRFPGDNDMEKRGEDLEAEEAVRKEEEKLQQKYHRQDPFAGQSFGSSSSIAGSDSPERTLEEVASLSKQDELLSTFGASDMEEEEDEDEMVDYELEEDDGLDWYTLRTNNDPFYRPGRTVKVRQLRQDELQVQQGKVIDYEEAGKRLPGYSDRNRLNSATEVQLLKFLLKLKKKYLESPVDHFPLSRMFHGGIPDAVALDLGLHDMSGSLETVPEEASRHSSSDEEFSSDEADENSDRDDFRDDDGDVIVADEEYMEGDPLFAKEKLPNETETDRQARKLHNLNAEAMRQLDRLADDFRNSDFSVPHVEPPTRVHEDEFAWLDQAVEQHPTVQAMLYYAKNNEVAHSTRPPYLEMSTIEYMMKKLVDFNEEIGDFEDDQFMEALTGIPTVIVDQSYVQKPTKAGQIANHKVLVLTGNGKGAVGFGIGRAEQNEDAAALATLDGLKNLVPIELYREQGLFQDLEAKFSNTKVWLRSTPHDFGISANNTVNAIFQLAGIKDGAAITVGNRNPYSVVKAVFKALSKHQSPEFFANARGRRLVDVNYAYEEFRNRAGQKRPLPRKDKLY